MVLKKSVVMVSNDNTGATVVSPASIAAINSLRAGAVPEDFGDKPGHLLPMAVGDSVAAQLAHPHQDGGM